MNVDTFPLFGPPATTLCHIPTTTILLNTSPASLVKTYQTITLTLDATRGRLESTDTCSKTHSLVYFFSNKFYTLSFLRCGLYFDCGTSIALRVAGI